MAFDPLDYGLASGFPSIMSEKIGEYWTTANVLKEYQPGQYSMVWDPLYGYRIFKLMKNLSNSAFAAGDLVSYVNPASVGTITAGSKLSITTSGLTADDLEYQKIVCMDDAGAAGGAPEGEASLCIANSTTLITLHPDYPFSAAIAASDTAQVIYANGLEDAAGGDLRGPGYFTDSVAGVVMSAVPDNSWGWVLQKGFCMAANTNALTACDLKAGTKTVVAAAVNAGQELIIGHSPCVQFAGNEESFAFVYIDVYSSIHLQTTP